MAFDVLNVFGLLAVNVAREIEVEIVFLDLVDTDRAGILRHIQPLVEDIDYLVDVHRAKTVLVSVLKVARAGVDHEDAFSGVGVFLVDDDDAGGNAGSVEEVCWQADDALDLALADECTANVGFRIASEQDTVRQNASAFAGGFERANDVKKVGVVALPAGGVPKCLKRP